MEDYYQLDILSQWILVDNDYFTILEERLVNRKTPIYHIISKHSKDEIGLIKWYGAWRKYCFFPNSNTIWDNKCLNEILNFLNDKNNKKR